MPGSNSKVARSDTEETIEKALKATNGNQTPSFEELYQDHFDFVWRTVRRLGVSPALLHDAAQDVFLVVHRRLGEYEPRWHPRTWLFAIAQRVASDYRRTERRKGGLLPLRDSLPAPEREGPYEGARKNQASDIILQFLESLDDNRRAAFILAELEQMSAAEVSAALGINQSTIYSRLRSARQELVSFVSRNHPDAFEGYNG